MRSVHAASPSSAALSRSSASADRKSTRLNSSHTEIYTLSLHDALPISSASSSDTRTAWLIRYAVGSRCIAKLRGAVALFRFGRSEEHTSELQSHRDLHSFPTRRSSDLLGE